MQLFQTTTRRTLFGESANQPHPQISTPLPGVEPQLYTLGLLGPALLGVSIGLQLAITTILLYGPIQFPLPHAPFTIRGGILTHPERDLPLYVGGVAICLMLMGSLTLMWRSAIYARPLEERQRFALFSAGHQAFLALAALVLYFIVLSYRLPLIGNARRVTATALNVLALLAPAMAAACCSWRDLRLKSNAKSGSSATKSLLFDMLFASLLVGLLFVSPRHWNEMAGTFYLSDNDLLHHWNFFGMGPALGYMHGGAFETDFYSQYGMGWPLLFATLGRLIGLTYGHMIGIGVIYGCIYYVALYALLRFFFRSSAWAAAAVLLAMTWQMFTGQFDGNIMWQYPSSTMLRHPMDVWFFLALLLHQRSGKLGWAAMAGAACGLGIFFETETGGYLAVTFGFYWLLTAWSKHLTPSVSRRPWQILGAFAAAVMLTLLPFMFLASRGTMFSGAFWSGWLEGLRLQAFSGLGLLPIAGVPDTALLFFGLFMVVYLLTIGVAVLRSLHGLGNAKGTFLACFSLYGLALLLIFVGRSHPYNLYHPSVPLAVVLMAWLWLAFRAAGEYMRRSSFPAVLTCVLLLLLISSADFAWYPGLARSALGRAPEPNPCLIVEPADVAVPPGARINAVDFRAAAAEMHRLAADGSEVAALDFEDTLLYYASGVRPAFRYASLFHTINTQADLDQHNRELLERRPRFIVMRAPGAANPSPSLFGDIYLSFHTLVEEHCKPVERVGSFEFWEWER